MVLAIPVRLCWSNEQAFCQFPTVHVDILDRTLALEDESNQLLYLRFLRYFETVAVHLMEDNFSLKRCMVFYAQMRVLYQNVEQTLQTILVRD
jgi:hypothetical protein